MKWFRFYSEIKDDPKMRKLADDEYRVFTYLMAIAADEDKGGIVPYNTDDLSWTLRAPVDLVDRTIARLTKLNILSPDGNGWKFTHWQARQFPSDNVTERTRRHREKEKETFDGTFEGTYR